MRSAPGSKFFLVKPAIPHNFDHPTRPKEINGWRSRKRSAPLSLPRTTLYHKGRSPVTLHRRASFRIWGMPEGVERLKPDQRRRAAGQSRRGEPTKSLCYDSCANCGGERGPVVLVAFKAIARVLRGLGGGFDSHTLPPYLFDTTEVVKKRGGKRRHYRPRDRFCELILGGTSDNRILEPRQ